MNHSDAVYLKLLREIVHYGEIRTDRTGTGTRSLFGGYAHFSLANMAVPCVGSKKVIWEKALMELNWMLRGETNIFGLGSAQNIWAPWADEDGELGPVYGAQWRNFNDESVDQIRFIVEELRERPDSRRAFMSAWNPAQLDEMALPPCPVSYQFSLRGENFDSLHLHVHQRSADMFLGVPFDLVEYAVLAHLVAATLGVRARALHWSYGDAHVYSNHMNQAKAMLREGAPVGNDPYLVLPPQVGYLEGYAEMHLEGYAYNSGYMPGKIAV